MESHKYILEPYKGMKSRYRCPACNNRDKTFVRYIDIQTGEHLAENVGKWNRANKCGYRYTPKQYFVDNKIYLHQLQNGEQSAKKVQNSSITKEFGHIIKKASQPVSLIPFETFKATAATEA